MMWMMIKIHCYLGSLEEEMKFIGKKKKKKKKNDGN